MLVDKSALHAMAGQMTLTSHLLPIPTSITHSGQLYSWATITGSPELCTNNPLWEDTAGSSSIKPKVTRSLASLQVTSYIREGKSPDDKKNCAFCTKFFANFHYFCVLFPSSCRNSTKPQHFTMHHYSAKQHSGIMYYVSPQPHVMQQFGL
jgi:hypothetical protein